MISGADRFTPAEGETAAREFRERLLAIPHRRTDSVRRLPALDPETIVMLGQRDEHYREAIAVPSIADRVRLHTAQDGLH